MRSEIRQLHEERDQLTRIIRSHASVCPLTPRHSPLTVVRESPLLVVPLRESPIIPGPGGGGGCSTEGRCEALALIRESPLTTGETLTAAVRESPLPSGSSIRESPLIMSAGTLESRMSVERLANDDSQAKAIGSGGRGKGSGTRDSPRLLRESPLLAALACLSSASSSSQPIAGAVQCGSQGETRGCAQDCSSSSTGRSGKNTSKSPVMGMTSGMSSFSLQSPVVIGGGGGTEVADGGSSGRTSRNGRRSSLLMQSPVMGGARPSVVMQSPALLVPPTRESPVPLLIINPSGGAPGGAGIGPGIGQATNTCSTTMTSPLPPSGRTVPSSPVPMSSRPRKSPIALFRGNPSPVHLHQQHVCNPIEQRLAMDQSPVLFGSPPKQSKHSIPPRLNLSGPKPVKPILPKPPSSSISSASSSASSSSFPCSSPRTPQSFMASPLPSTASPVSATGRPSHASPVFFGKGCFTPSAGEGLPSSNLISAADYGIQQTNKSPMFHGDDIRTVNKSPFYRSDKSRQSPMQKPDSYNQTSQSPLCILEAMRQINQSPLRKPDVKRKLNQSPLCSTEAVKQHISRSPINQIESSRQTTKSPGGCVFNSPARTEHSPMTISDSTGKNISISSSRITQQSPVFFGSGKGSNPPPSANNGQFLQPQPLPRSTAVHAKGPPSSLLTLLQRGNPLASGTNKAPVISSEADNPLNSSNAGNAFATLKTNTLFHSNRGSGVFSTTPNSNTVNCSRDDGNVSEVGNGVQTTQGQAVCGSLGSMFSANSSLTTRDSDSNSNLVEMSCGPTNIHHRDEPNLSTDHEIIDVDELDETYNRSKNNNAFIGSHDNNAFGNFGLVNNIGNNNSSAISNNTISLDTTKAQGADNVTAPFLSGQNAFAPTLGLLNKNIASNAPASSTSIDVNMNKNSCGSDAPSVPEQPNSFNTARMFPDSPALPSPSIMLDDNALSLEEIERSAAVLEGRDDFMDLLDIQALLELSADHNTSNSNSNSNNTFGSCDNYVDPDNTDVINEGNKISRNENQKGNFPMGGNIVQTTNASGPGFNVSQSTMVTNNKTGGDVNANPGPFVQNPVLSVFNPQSMAQENVANRDSNFLFNNPSTSMQTDVDRYAQILASFRSLQNISQNSTTPNVSGHLQSLVGTQQCGGVVQANCDASGTPVAQSNLSNLTGIMVSSATSTIHHHPTQSQQTFLIPAQSQASNYIESANSTLIPAPMANTQNFLITPQSFVPGNNQGNIRIENQDNSFAMSNQSIAPPFRIENQQPPSQPRINQDKYNFNDQWQTTLPRSTTALVAGFNQVPDQRREMVIPQTNDASSPISSATPPSGFSTYRSRLRELLNAPTTPDVNSSPVSGGPNLCAPTNNTTTFTSGATHHPVWESQAKPLTTNSGFNITCVQRLDSDSASDRVSSFGQSSVWEPPTSGGPAQTEGKKHSGNNMQRE